MITPVTRESVLELPGAALPGDLAVPQDPEGLVVFAHGSGSTRRSSRNRYVAGVLEQCGLATLLFDLLTPEEDRDRAARFDIQLLTRRLIEATGWVRGETGLSQLPLGYFGASTGAAAALGAAAEMPVEAVVSRGGRPDLAMEALPRVSAPTLLIVGGADTPVIRYNEEAYARLNAPKHLAIVAGATHLFEEPGALERVASLASDWFARHLVQNEG